jgi:hypothetical protein
MHCRRLNLQNLCLKYNMPFFIYDEKMASLFDRILGGLSRLSSNVGADQLNPRKLIVRAHEMVGWRCSLLGCISRLLAHKADMQIAE